MHKKQTFMQKPSIGWSAGDFIMKARIALPIAITFVVLGLLGWSNPEVVGSLFEEVRENVSSDEGAEIIGIQAQEKWLVIVVDFDDSPAQAGRDVLQAKGLLNGDNGAQGYIEQLTGGTSNLNLTFIEQVFRATHDSTDYGHDQDGERDVGIMDGGPASLAEQVISEAAHSVDWEEFDLNGDGAIDRLLILHTARPQEDGSGSSSRIWSHFGPLVEPVSVSGGLKVHHYTMASLRSSNYRGTMIHEMLHQIGAVDLYAVHDETVSQSWFGVGGWDVMASGNWNGNGAVPAMPMAASMQLLGVDRTTDVNTDIWFEDGDTCRYPTINISPISQGADAYRINIAEGEWLWMENRNNDGFDSRLPGHGLLVSVQNTNVGDLEANAVNQDVGMPWLYIVEADGGDELQRAADKGSATDPFHSGDSFGASGEEVRDSHGRLVQWTANISEDSFNNFQVNLTRPSCDSTFEVLPPSGAVRTLPGESFEFAFRGGAGCQPLISLNVSDGRKVIGQLSPIGGDEWQQLTLNYDSVSTAGSSGIIQGEVSCGDEDTWNIKIPWSLHSNRILPSVYKDDVPISLSSDVLIELEVEGSGVRVVDVIITGPLSRIASAPEQVEVSDGSVITIAIEPQGLVTPGMLARGEVLFVDELGKIESVEVELTGEGISGSADVIRGLRDPSVMSLLVCSLAAIWVLLGIERRKQPIDSMQERHQPAQGAEDFYLTSAPLVDTVSPSSSQQDSFHGEEY
jgi:M6 family metalloprotease-like protein